MISILDKFDGVTENTAEKQYNEESFVESTTWLGEIKVDLLEDVSPVKRWTVPRHRIGKTSTLSDHRIKEPEELELTILVTDDETMGKKIGDSVLVTEKARTWKDKAKELEEYADIDQVIEVVTPFDVYPSMIITNFSPLPQTAIGNGMQYSVSLEEIRLGSVSTIALDKSLIPKKRKAKKKNQPPPSDKLNETTQTGNKEAWDKLNAAQESFASDVQALLDA